MIQEVREKIWVRAVDVFRSVFPSGYQQNGMFISKTIRDDYPVVYLSDDCEIVLLPGTEDEDDSVYGLEDEECWDKLQLRLESLKAKMQEK